MRLGLLSDAHAGYTRGTKEVDGINVREQDVLTAFSSAVDNLVAAEVEAICDLGDLFHVPHAKKRALLHVIKVINDSGLDYYSVSGNHTLVRTRSDIHVYDLLAAMCPRFHGFVQPALVPDIGAYLIPYGQEAEALVAIPDLAQWIGGHWAAENAPFPGEHVQMSDLPSDIPTLLGHYHTRQIAVNHIGTYIGATERFAWGEADNPTGVAVFDTDTERISFIDHETREWIDVNTDVERLMDDLRDRDFEGKIVRVTVDATPQEYHGLDIKSIREIGRAALEFQIRRAGSKETFTTDHADTATYSLLEAWQEHTAAVKPSEMRKAVQARGSKALAEAGVGE